MSRSPLPSGHKPPDDGVDRVVAKVEPELESDIATCQRRDSELASIILYLETGVLPDDDSSARTLVLSASQYVLEDDVLYKVEQDSTLRVIPPADWREELFNTAHSGIFGGHLSDVKVHSELQSHYWWSRMRKDVPHLQFLLYWSGSTSSADTDPCWWTI